MTVQINWPTQSTTLYCPKDTPIFASILTDSASTAITLTCYPDDQSGQTTTVRFIHVVPVEGQYLWLFDVALPPPPSIQGGVVQCTLRVEYTDDQNQQVSGSDETSFRIEYLPPIISDNTGILWPKSGDEIPTTNFIPQGRLDALLPTSAPAPCIHGYPCLLENPGPNQKLIDPTSGPFEDPVVLHRWHAIYASLDENETYSLRVVDVKGVGDTSKGLTT